MAQVARSQRFLLKAEAALIAAIEVYNKPDFRYREESFAILILNAWELLLKAKLLHLSGNDPRSLFVYECRQAKTGKPTKKRYLKRNRAGNCQTLGLGPCIAALEKRGAALAPGVRKNLDAVTEVRDNAVHYVAAGSLLTKQVFEFGTAAVVNFIRLSREWFGHDLSKYHLFIMPIGFVAPPPDAESIVVSSDEAQLVQYLSLMAASGDVRDDDPYQVSLTLSLKMKRTSMATGLKVAITNDPDAPKLFLKEEDFRARYPWDYAELSKQMSKRYTDFKLTEKYHKLRKSLTADSKYCMSRFLDPGNPKSARKEFFSQQIMTEFDKHYSLRKIAALPVPTKLPVAARAVGEAGATVSLRAKAAAPRR